MNVNQKYKVKEFEWFQMETKVRQMVQEIVTPIQKRIMENSTNIVKIKEVQHGDTSKVQQLTLMIANDPKVFELGIFKQVDQRFQVHQKAIQEVRRLIQESNNYVSKKFQLLDLRMRQSNQTMMNFSALKERVNKEIEIQNENIHKIRLNLQKMIQRTGQEILSTNQKVVQNLMRCQKMDKSLEERIRNSQTQIEVSKQAIQNNKKLIIDKNIQMEAHQFKIEKAFQRIVDIQNGQQLSRRMEQYIKDMQITIKKCEFRVQAITPLVTMAQVQQALQYILPQKLRKKIIVFGHKKYNKLNRQILEKKYNEAQEVFNGMELVETMQKKNTRQITNLKRKKIISMGIDIDHLTFQARQRYYNQINMDQLSQQEEDNQTHAKIDEAEILNLVSLYFNEFTTDVSQKVKNQLEDTKNYLYGVEGQIKKQMEMNEQKIQKCEDHCIGFHRDQMLEMKAVQSQLLEAENERVQIKNWLVNEQQTERKFYNFCSLINHLQIQDEIDKQNISLMGIQQHNASLDKESGNNPQRNSIIQIQKNCFSCCGYPASVLSSFKMACLAYHPSSIVIDDKQYKRQDILQFTTNILQTIKSKIQTSNSGQQSNVSPQKTNNEGLSKTLNPNQSKIQEKSLQTLQKYGNSRLEYSPLNKSRFEQTTTINNLNSKLTMKNLQINEVQINKKSSSIRLRKSLRRDHQTSDQKQRKNSHTRNHSNSLSKDMINVTNNFMDLKKRHLSYLN